MKTLKLVLALMALFVATASFAQSNHPTVASVKVKYRYDSSIQTNTSIANIQAIPEATVTLVTTNGVSKIYFKVFDNTNTIVYQVNYNLNSSVITNGQGNKLFENNNGVIFISSGQATSLKPYTYKVSTEDNQSNQTSDFSVIQ
ncbi:MAG: hypothetical protein K0S32_904 [Bacteroidetes bacterium]|jgi:hypothetical protein|nr:hypothetical protein [Bacteroidota bacterium]